MSISKLVCKTCGKDLAEAFNKLAVSPETALLTFLLHFMVHNPNSIKPKYEATVDGEVLNLNWLGDKED